MQGQTKARLARSCAMALLTAALITVPVAAQEARLTPENLKKVAFVLLQQGKPDRALAMADALLQQFPDDTSALILKSRAERDLGRYPSALATARQAWTGSDDPRGRYGAALAAAQALASDGHKYRAQFWLRRAIQTAPNDRAKTVAAQDFAYVRSRSRLALKFDVGLQPSSNVNNGSSSDTLWFLGLPFTLSADAQALSGVKARVGMSGRYRLTETETAKTDLNFSIVQESVMLSDSARLAAPDARGGDYAFSAIELGLERSLRFGPRDEVQLGILAGSNWYGGAKMSNYVQGNLAYRRDLTPRLRASGGIALERQWRQDDALRSADLATISLGLDRVLPNQGRLRVQVKQTDTRSAASDIDHRGWGADLDWTPGKTVLGGRLSLGLSVAGRDYDRSRYGTDGRHDLTIGAEALVAFENVEYMGFVPVLSVATAKTSSNISLYESRSTGVGLRVQSKF